MENPKMCHEMSIPADHSTIVKFDNESDQHYKIIRGHLQRLVKDAPKVIMKRFPKGAVLDSR